MSKQDPIKPTTKDSYAMSKGQTSNRFEVLGKIPKPKVLASQNPIHISKESKLLIQVLEVDHKSASGSFELKKLFQKDKFFISNDISKTHRFYEFILVDMESIQVSHIKNPEDTDIAYSKCKILKSISENDWEQSPFTHKRFSQNFVPQTFDYIDYKEAWFNTFYVRPSSHSWFFNWGENVGSPPFVTPQGTLQVGPTHKISSFPLSSFRLPRDSNPGPRVFSPMGSISG